MANRHDGCCWPDRSAGSSDLSSSGLSPYSKEVSNYLGQPYPAVPLEGIHETAVTLTDRST